ncbi:hypothetical protein BDSB_26605 [Burkholderia dolosa PC543]|nr:hypothetical protein BDSB_26605 [Burkholderia dolosa PC543]
MCPFSSRLFSSPRAAAIDRRRAIARAHGHRSATPFASTAVERAAAAPL